MRRALGPIDDKEIAYIRLLLDQQDEGARKTGLQLLGRRYRQGLRARQPVPLRTTVLGLLVSSRSAKVCRWCLNVLCFVGDVECIPTIGSTIQLRRDDPDVVNAGLAAIFALAKDRAPEALAKYGLPMEGEVLVAAAQFTDRFNSQLVADGIAIDTASPALLRSAIVLVGLDKAPESLFNKRFENRVIIGELNGHDDASVSQYSVWATCESNRLGISDLRIRLDHLDDLPPNVRGWVYKLLTTDPGTAKLHHASIAYGAEADEHEEAREGLAEGLRDVYYDGLEVVIIDWLLDEENSTIKQRLLEHMAKNARECTLYGEYVLAFYRDESENSIARARLEAAAKGSFLYIEMRKIQLNSFGSDLFASGKGDTHVTSQIFNGPVTIGANTASGSAVNGTVNANVIATLPIDFDALLGRLLGAIERSPELEDAPVALIEEARKTPTKGALEKIVSWAKVALAAGKFAVDAREMVGEIYQAIEPVLETLG